jgi:phosphatidylinositol glycan class B
MLHILAARPLASVFYTRKASRLLILALGIAVNIYIAYYVSFVHQRGVIDVMHHLRQRQVSQFDVSRADKLAGLESVNITVGFLMPCHSTPWRSHLVYPEISAWALTCEPPIHIEMERRGSYLDEADVFYQDPTKWLAENLQNLDQISSATDPDVKDGAPQDVSAGRAWPHYLVAFEQLQPTLAPILEGTRYKVSKRFFNTHWHDDRRRAGDVIVWSMRR